MLRLTVAFWLFAGIAAAEEAPAPEPLELEPHGVFVGDSWRYQHHGVLTGFLTRTLADLVSIPTGVGGWEWGDVAVTAATVGVTVAFEWPAQPSIDVRLYQGLQRKMGENHLKLWTPIGDTIIWLSLYSALFGTLAGGLISGASEFTETALLAIEAWIVTQVYVNAIKVFTGREGPLDESGQGTFHGPSAYLKYFPSGTPSGHVASIWALFAVVMQYWHQPVLWAVLTAAGVVLSMTTVTDGYHFPSEAIIGAAMGIAIGRWVVRHRSSRYRYGHRDDEAIEQVTLAPTIVPGSSYGLALSFRF